MATLQKIRSKGPLVAVVIGFALLAFILGDFLSRGVSMFGDSEFEIVNIENESISYQEYLAKVDQLTEIEKIRTRQATLNESAREKIRRQVWELIIRENIMQKRYNDLGIGVSSDEFYDMVGGKNVDPVIRQSFTNPQTGQYDPSAVINFIQNIDQDKSGQSKILWLYMENELLKNRQYVKYNTLVSKGLNVTKAEVETKYKERNYIVDFDYVIDRYDKITDSLVDVSESEIEKYYSKNKNSFNQLTSRDIAYITFDVKSSADDENAVKTWINRIYEEFKTVEDSKAFVNQNSDNSFDEKHYKKGEFKNVDLDTFLFSATVGDTYAPYLEDKIYKTAKLTEIVTMADSVKARHILIYPDGELVKTKERAKEIADSLKTELDNGADFADLVSKHSADEGTKADSGSIGWIQEGQMVKPFSDACFFGNIGELQIIESKFGYHIVDVLAKGEEFKKVQVAIIDRKIEPSKATSQRIYSEASRFAGENNTSKKFNAAIEKNGYTLKSSPGMTPTQKFIAGLDSPRELVRWAYKAEKNEISNVFEFGDRFVVAELLEIREKGIAPIKIVKKEIIRLIRIDKKAEKIIKELEPNMSDASLESIAQKLSSKIAKATNVSFSAYQIASIGYEPVLISNAINLEKDKISKLIKGNSGVYVIKVTSITSPISSDKINYTIEKARLKQSLQARANYQIFEALKESANIKDNRAKFF